MKKLTRRSGVNFFDSLDLGCTLTATQGLTWGEIQHIANDAGYVVHKGSKPNTYVFWGMIYGRGTFLANEISKIDWPTNEDYPEPSMKAIINLFNEGDKEAFLLLDEKPANFGRDFYDRHFWKLRRVRNRMGEELFARF